jgi:glucose-1-phosphate adenylyltransferase
MRDVLSKTVTFVLAGGRGERLSPLTRRCSKPAVPFGDGRIIDFALGNCLQSNLTHPLVITQYQAAHLTQHVRRWWPKQSASGADPIAAPVCVPSPLLPYTGTADALLQNLRALQGDARDVLVLSADHIYEMDYRELLQCHIARNADATLATIVYPSASSRRFGIVETDAAGRVAGFQEKPDKPKELLGKPGRVLANMGIYIFRREVLLDALQRDAEDSTSAHDIGRNILPELVKHHNVFAFRFEDPVTGRPRYWKDVGTIDSYYEAGMEWLARLPSTHHLARSGSVIAGGVRIHCTAEVIDSILLPGVVIGPGARIRRAILDENVQVMPGAEIGYDANSNCVVVVG